MSKKDHSPGPVPPGNRPQAGDEYTPPEQGEAVTKAQTGGDAEQDQERQPGGYTGKGEPARQQ